MRTHAEHVQAILLASGLPRYLWAKAMRHTVWLQNRSATCALNGKTPYEIVHGTKPHLAGIQEFGAAAYIKSLDAGKLDPRAQKGRFVGYDLDSKGYRIYWPTKRTITVERDVTFNHEDFRLQSDESVVIFGDVLDEGERNKIIHEPHQTSHELPSTHPEPPMTHPEPHPEDLPQAPKLRRMYDVLPEPEPNTG